MRKIGQENRGSTLIVVLIAVSFMSVLAAIILSISSANLKMKQIEYASKKNFYVDEVGLDDIYNGIGRDVSKALSRSYARTLMDANVTGGMYPTQRAAYSAFSGSLYNELKLLYGDASPDTNDDTLAKLRSYIVDQATTELVTYQGITVVADTEMGAPLFQYIFEGVEVKHIEANRFETIITTDIVLEVPYIDFFQNFNQVLDYALIGNKGISFLGSVGKRPQIQVEGNVYAGIDSKSANAMYNGYSYDTAVYDGMNVYKANVTFKDCSYIVSRGDFNVCESSVIIDSKESTVSREAQSNLWVENLRTVENGRTHSAIDASVLTRSLFHATANVYAADDLELNAKNSDVKLSGNYYGYNFNSSGSVVATSYETEEKKALAEKYSTVGLTNAAHTTSSAIVINGNQSTLDLSDLNTLMVAGVAYVDIKTPDKSYSALSPGEANEYKTGESIAMRYNQFLYLAPTDILEGVANPEKNGTVNAAEVCPSSTAETPNIKLQEWFGTTYLDQSSASPVIPVVYNDHGTSYTYYFLRLSNEKGYIEDVMSITADPGETGEAFAKQKWKLKQDILSKNHAATSIASHIVIAPDSSASEARIYTTGLLTDTGSSGQTFQNNSISLDDMAGRSVMMQNHYRQLYVNLEPAKTETVESEKLSDMDYPLKNFLELSNFEGRMHLEEKKVSGVRDAGVWILEEVGGVHPVLNLPLTETKKGIVLCNGDLTITGGGAFEGLIVATGKITITGDVTLRADQGIVQAVLEAEQRHVTELTKEEADTERLTEYASYYFNSTLLAGLIDLNADDLVDVDKRVKSMEYTDFMYYKNWQKGEAP